MSPTLPHKDAWTRAVNRYVGDLSPEEKILYQYASAESLFYDASAAEKVHVSKSTSLKVLNKLQPLMAAIEQYGQAIDVYSNAYPLAMAPLWGSIRVVLHLSREYGKYFDRIVEMFASIGDVLPRFKVYEDLFPSHERLVQALSITYVDIINFCTKSKAVFRHGRRTSLTNLSIAFKLSWKPFEGQFGKDMDGFRLHLKNVEKEASLSHMIEAADARAVVLANKIQLEKAKKESHHRRLISAIPSVNYVAIHEKLQQARYDGTGTWIFDNDTFKEWRDSRSSALLCCLGIPGCGKTILASSIIDRLIFDQASKTPRVVYYYCDYADPTTLTIDRIVGTLLKQFFDGNHIPAEIEAKIPQEHAQGGKALETGQLMNLLRVAVNLDSGIIFVVDGLDECEKTTQKQITQFLHQLSQIETAAVKTLILCRDEDQLLLLLQGVSKLRLTASALESDIKSFVTGSVKSRISSGELRIRNPKLESEIISGLVSKAQGMFLWVFFQLDDLCEAPSDALIRETLQNLPNGLGETYERILTKIRKSPMKSTLARKLFVWVAHAQRPMKVEEIREAVAFEPSDKTWDPDKLPDDDLMIQSCRGLIIRELNDGTVRFAHHTIRQYLFSNLAGIRNDSFTCTRLDEILLGEMCLTYLSLSDFDTQIEIRAPETKPELTPAIFQSGTALWLPSLLGSRSSVLNLPYRFLSSYLTPSNLNLDYPKYLKPIEFAKDTVPSQKLVCKYQLLEYVIENWVFHTRDFDEASSRQRQKLRDLARYKSLPFEFRPWGANGHYGPYGCVCSGSPSSTTRLPLMSLFHYAAKVGHWELMADLVDDYCSHESPHDETLILACRNDQLLIVSQLLNRRDFDVTDGRAINAAAASGNETILSNLLVTRNPSRNLSSVQTLVYSVQDFGHIPLNIAAANGHEGIVELLCNLKAKIDAHIDDDGTTALSSAASNGHDHVVRRLLAKGATILTTGATAVHGAAENGHEVVVRTLLQADAPINIYKGAFNILRPPHLVGALDWNEETPLHKAARKGHRLVVEVLLEYGPMTQNWVSAQTNSVTRQKGAYRQGAIHLAAANGHLNVLQILSRHTSIDSRTSRQETPLHLAAGEGHVSAIEWLVNNKASTHVQDENGYNALQFAVVKGREESVNVLLGPGMGPPELFVLAARKGHEGVLTLLLEQGKSQGMSQIEIVAEAHDIALAESQHEAADRLKRLLVQYLQEEPANESGNVAQIRMRFLDE